MIFLVHRPISNDVLGMSSDDLNDFMAIPDNKGIDFKIEMAWPEESHECVGVARWADSDEPIAR